MEKLCVVIPMKSPKKAKQRLSTRLSRTERECLAMVMFQSTLIFFRSHFPNLALLVVSESEEVLSLAESYSTNLLYEEGVQGLNHALYQASEWVTNQGFTQQLIVPSDIALLDKQEILQLLGLAEKHQVIVARAKDGGTNALLSSPPQAVQFKYGKDSAKAHCAEAFYHGLSYYQIDLPHLSLDIDQSDDLEKAISQQPERFATWQTLLSTSPLRRARYA